MFFIYQYHDPRTWDLVYIGLTDNLERRMKQHLLRSDSPLYPLASELRGLGLQLHSSILDSHADLETAKQLEKKYIQEKKPILNTVYNMVSSIDQPKMAVVALDEKPIAKHFYQDDEGELIERRKRGKQAFDKVHMRWTLWINKKLKKRIDKLAKEEEVSLVALAEEAFTDLLKKHEGK